MPRVLRICPRRRAGVVLLAATVASGLAVVPMGNAAVAAPSCTATWVGAAGGDWSVAANWSPATVPGATSSVCVSGSAGPAITAGYAAQANSLTATGTTMTIDGTLTVGFGTITRTDLSGSGTYGTTGSTTLSGVLATGRLTVSGITPNGSGALLITGQRRMCGGTASLCLTGSSAVQSKQVLVTDGIVRGTTTAAPAVTTTTLDLEGSRSSRILVAISASRVDVDGATTGFSGRLDDWTQLATDGTLSGTAMVDTGALVVARPIVAVSAVLRADAGAVLTPDGLSALRGLTTVENQGFLDAELDLPTSAITPAGGTLTVAAQGRLRIAPGLSPARIDGAVANSGDLFVDGDLRAQSLTDTGAVDLTAALTAATQKYRDAAVDMSGDSKLAATGAVVMSGTTSLIGSDTSTCATIQAGLTMAATARVDADLGAPDPSCPAVFSVFGRVSLPATLAIAAAPGATLGDQVILLDSATGVRGTFTTITGQNVGPDHWAVSYPGKQVVLTLLAGNV